MKKSTLFASVAVVAALAFAPLAHAAEEFSKKAAMGGEFEVQESQLALQKSANPAIKQFAQQMVADHTKAGNDLKAAMPAAGVTPAEAPMRLDDKHAKMLKDLSEKNGTDFDKQYVKDQEAAHKDTIKLFKDYSKNGENPQLKTFATNTLPTLQQHKDMIDNINKSM